MLEARQRHNGPDALNYRHAFHAGNFADIVKHAALLLVLERLKCAPGPLAVVDTHAGGGLYDLSGVEARRSGEAEAGVGRLMADSAAPEVFGALKASVARANGERAGQGVYPGSPWLIAEALRPGDRYAAFELRADEHAALRENLKGRAGVETRCADGFEGAPGLVPARGAALVLIDPPFERPDDHARAARTAAAVRRRNPAAVVMIWLPLKDLETFDAFLRDLEDAEPGPLLIGEARLRPLTDPMKMNGCALVFVEAPEGLEAPLAEICRWAAGPAGEGRVWSI